MNERPVKVLSVCTFDAGGGAHNAAYRIHQGVRVLGVDSRMFVKKKHNQSADIISLDEFVPHNPLCQFIDWIGNKFRNKLQRSRWNRYPDSEDVFMSDLRGTALHGALRKLDYDVLHLHWINLRFIPLEELPKDKPIVWTMHDSWAFCGICHSFLECEGYKKECGCCAFLHSDEKDDLSHQVWEKKAKLYKDLDLHIVSPSRWLADCVGQSSLLERFPVTVIPNCLDTKAFSPFQKEKNKAKPVVLYGAINAATNKSKGFATLLSALKILEQQGHGNDFELVVFGINELDLDIDVNIPISYVGFVDNMDKLVSLYRMASVVVVPSLTENLSCVIMESMSCGTPVVAFNIGGNGDMIEHKTNGYLAKAKDDADLAEGILWCLENNPDNCLGKSGREKVLREYTYQVVCGKYKELYETLHHNHQS